MPTSSTTEIDPIAAYALGMAEEWRTICDRLQRLIEAHLPQVSGRIWHGAPVWFDGENPVVGYEVKVKGVSLLFWDGQAMGDPALKPAGKYGAAAILFTLPDELDEAKIAAWLCWAGENVFDSVGFFKSSAKRVEPVVPVSENSGAEFAPTCRIR